MSESAIREQIKTILSGVDGIGVVHDYQRWAATWEKFLDHFKVEATGTINGWMFSRTATPERWLTNVKYIRVYEWLIRGVYGLKDEDATETTFQALIEAVCDAFRSEDTLNGTCETTNPEFGSLAGLSGVQVALVENRSFGGMLCHYCELRLGTQVVETRE
jgi:hypothetical protein